MTQPLPAIKLIRKKVFSGAPVLTGAVGSLLFSNITNPGQLIFIEQGHYRLIDKKKSFKKLTLLTTKESNVYGFSQLIKADFVEEIRAISICKYRIISINDLNEEQINLLKGFLKKRISPFELPFINFLLQRFGEDPRTEKNNLKSLFTRISFQNSIHNKTNVADYVVYLDSTKKGFKYGQFVPLKICQTFFSANDWPRIIKINGFNRPAIKSEESSDIEIDFSQENNEEINSESLPIEDSVSTIIDKFKFKKGSSRKECYSSCLEMIVDHFELPTRRDTINRASLVMDKDKIPWTKVFLGILDSLGLSVRAVRVNLQSPMLVPIPSIWIDKSGFPSIISKASGDKLTFLNPKSGIQDLRIEDVVKRFKESPVILSVSTGIHTPKKRFDLKWLYPFLIRYKFQLIEVFASSFLTQLFALATPLLFQQIIDRVISKGAYDALSPLVILMIGFVLLETTFSSLKTFQFVEVSNRIDVGVGSSIISRMLRLNARFFDRRPVGELSSRLGELDNIRRFLTGTALTAVLDAIFAILYFIIMFFYSPLLTLIVILTVPLLFLVAVGATPVTQKLIRNRAEASSRTQSLLVEILSGIQTIKLQNAELTARQQWEDRHLNTINQGFKAILANTFTSNAIQLINKISSILVIGVGAWLVLKNELTIGGLIAFRIISGYVTQPMLRLASTWQSFQEMSLSLERVGDIVNQTLEVEENEEENIIMPSIVGEVKIDSVSYSYTSQSAPVLSSVSLKIKPGNFVGVVGQSGCGKSSLIKMIPRLYRPSNGKIMVDNYDISKIDLYEYRKQIGFVPQDCVLFEGTVFSNIALSDPQVESSKVIEMAKIACAHDFIMSLPYGYSTPIGEKGSGLSGGQKQRISLARMLLENPNLVVLDEATSALDVDTERQVVNNFKEHFKNKTVIMITHRLTSLTEADDIFVMHEGKLDSHGNHLKLMEKKGRYFALFQSQFGKSE
tara:strand:+ start:14529 stop:17414 length:2886 start_codon:yes stop_codon:yes gene_type:complete